MKMLNWIMGILTGTAWFAAGGIVIYVWFLVILGIIGAFLGSWKAAVLAGILLVPFILIARKSAGIQKFFGGAIIVGFVVAVVLATGLIPERYLPQPGGLFFASETEETLFEEETRIFTEEDERKAKLIKKIGERKRKGERLENYEINLWNEAVRERNENTLPAKIKGGISGLQITWPTSAPAAEPKKRTEEYFSSITINPDDWPSQQVALPVGKYRLSSGEPVGVRLLSEDGPVERLEFEVVTGENGATIYSGIRQEIKIYKIKEA